MSSRGRIRHAHLLCGAATLVLAAAGAARAQEATFNIPPQPLTSALNAFGVQSHHAVMFTTQLTGAKTSPGVNGAADTEVALNQVLAGSGLTYRKNGETYLIVAGESEGGNVVQELVVTAQKKSENIQVVPIAISAFTQQDLTTRQVAGGPDLMTQVPNMTFTKTNFTSYSIQIRGIGTQAISATTDPAVAVAFNNTPFVRNRFFEQEFYDLERVEVLRGPQGTLYGRNATAGVVNILSAKPTFDYAERASVDVGNYSSHRLEGMVNLPLVDDRVALRIAGAWTKRDGYDTNAITGSQIDGRDLWSTRLSLRFKPTDRLDANLIWEHFQENDDRIRSGKQLCHRDDRTDIEGHSVPPVNGYSALFSQGCLAASLYSPDSYQAPNGLSLPYYLPLGEIFLPVKAGFNPYASTVQSPDLRVIESTVDPKYRAKSDLAELQISYNVSDNLTLSSESSYSSDFIFSSEDFNRFNTAHGAFRDSAAVFGQGRPGVLTPGEFGGIFCDPQIGCADRVVAVDLSTATSRQFSQEFRLSSDYAGRFNFSLGANFLRYDTEDKYYVFINTLSLYAAVAPYDNFTGLQALGPMPAWVPGISDNHECLLAGKAAPDPTVFNSVTGCVYVDPNPIDSLNDQGHNYFLSRNPYKLISYAAFGEVYYNLTDTLKLTGGLRWTVDKKEAPRIPSWVLGTDTVGYPVSEVIRQRWSEPTGRLTLDWGPKLAFTDQTLLYASFARGYKAGGANPPPPGPVELGDDVAAAVIHDMVTKPRTFQPEFVNAFEIGTKNTLLDGHLTVNADAFYYDYTGYQISQIIDRSAVNYNFDAKIWGLELEADWQPLKNLRLGFKGGYEHTRVADGSRAIDIMDRTAGHPGWVVVRPFPTQTSNCILPTYVVTQNGTGAFDVGNNSYVNGLPGPCEYAYLFDHDPVTNLPYVKDPEVGAPGYDPYPGYPGFDPDQAGINHGEGFYKDLSGHELPNAPHFTGTITVDYTLPLPREWLLTLHTDLYGQSEAWTRIFNTPGYDRLKAYSNINVAAIFTNEAAGLKVMAYVKNVLDHDSITGAFLNSDDTGLTTNVFLTEPRLYGLRVTKEWTGGGAWMMGVNPDHKPGEPYSFTLEIGGQVQRQDAPYETISPSFAGAFSPALAPNVQHGDLDWGDEREARLIYRPAGSAWTVSAGYRFGKTNSGISRSHNEEPSGDKVCAFTGYLAMACDPSNAYYLPLSRITGTNFSDASARSREEHTIVDFAVGRDFGMGGLDASSLSLGLRSAKFDSTTAITFGGAKWAIPVGWYKYDSTQDQFDASLEADRTFKGAGPTLSWSASRRLLGDEAVGHVELDWSATGGVLFGRQKTAIAGQETEGEFVGSYRTVPRTPATTPLPTAVSIQRSKSVSAPLLDLSVGFSYEIQRLKISTGYRWERYFNVLDAGYRKGKSYDRTFDGPYLKVSVGFGG